MIGFDMTLQQLRLEKGLTLAELAELSGLSLGRIGNWEAWSRDPRPKTARDPLLMSMQSALRLSSALDVSLDTLAQCLAESSPQDDSTPAESFGRHFQKVGGVSGQRPATFRNGAEQCMTPVPAIRGNMME